MGFLKKEEKKEKICKQLTAKDARFITDGKQVEPEIDKILAAIKTKAEAGKDSLDWNIGLSRFWATELKEKLKKLGYKVENRDDYSFDYRRVVIMW